MICCLNPDCEQPLNRDRDRNCQCCGKPLKKLLDNRYKVAKPLGRGGFGKIYLAQDTRKFDELCVVKQLAFGGKGTKVPYKVKQLFEKEAIQLQRLGMHPQIPALFAYFEEDNYLYLVQQFIKGQNLLEKLEKEGRFSETKIREFLLELLPLLQSIHSCGVVHRDIKLSNIMWAQEEGTYILIDFGISKMFSSSIMKTRGTTLGSYGYAAPEQILNGKVSTASDLFSLGATCFHLLTGISPSQLWEEGGYDWVENWQQWLKKPISLQLTFVLDKLLQKNVTQRYQKAATVLLECKQSLISETSALRDTKYAVKSLMLRRAWLKLAALSVLSVLGVGIAVVAGNLNLFEEKQAALPQNSPQPAQTTNSSQFMAVDNVPFGVFHYGGSTNWAPIRRDVDPIIQSVWSEFKLRYVEHPVHPPGSGTGIWMLLHNQIAFAQSSRPLKSEEKRLAQKSGFTLEQIPIAIDAIAIAVHPKLNIPGLTVAQLKDIYDGKITNWQEVGGPNLAIIPYSRHPEAGGTADFFRQQVLNKEKFASQVQFIPTTTLGIRAVAANRGGIYYASAAEVVEQCTVKPIPIGYSSDKLVPPYIEPLVKPKLCPQRRNQINHSAFQQADYPLTQNLFVIIKRNGQIEEQAGRAYANLMLTDRGQELIEKAGYTSLR